jgi:hypothetical protein
VASVVFFYGHIGQLPFCNEPQDLLLVLVETLPHTEEGILSGLAALALEVAELEFLSVGLRGVDVIEEEFELLEGD